MKLIRSKSSYFRVGDRVLNVKYDYYKALGLYGEIIWVGKDDCLVRFDPPYCGGHGHSNACLYIPYKDLEKEKEWAS